MFPLLRKAPSVPSSIANGELRRGKQVPSVEPQSLNLSFEAKSAAKA
jgi:hypothetical protein